MSAVQQLQNKITSKEALVGIIGMGYVGKSLAELVDQKDFPAIGFVLKKTKTDTIYTTTDISLLKTCDILLICVQTPIDENKKPDLHYLKKAIQQVTDHLRIGQLIIIESSIAVGTTRNTVLPILKQSGLKEGKDYFLAFSPERMDPGNTNFALNEIPKVVAGVSKQTQLLAVTFYEQIIEQVTPVSSVETAELIKLFENTFRFINISFVNEIQNYAKAHGINMWEVIEAASSKPFGFLAHYPSPGVGGHCIPVDPFYLLEDAQKKGVQLSLIEKADEINDAQPQKVAAKAVEIPSMKQKHQAYITEKPTWTSPSQTEHAYTYQYAGMKGGTSTAVDKPPEPYNVLLIGLAYKPNIDDMRESPALKIWRRLEEQGCKIIYHDPYIPSYSNHHSQNLSPSLIKEQDLIIIVTDHSNVPYAKLASYGVPILDTRNVYTNGRKFSHIYDL